MGKKRKVQNNLVDNEHKKKKNNKIDDNGEVDDDLNTESNRSKQSTRNDKETSSNCRKSKKIIFVDDEPQEVPVTTSNAKKTKPSKKIKQQSNDILKEEDIKDDDIDKFCGELNEEDNKEYENWVELIEANLNSNKKKPKYLKVLF